MSSTITYGPRWLGHLFHERKHSGFHSLYSGWCVPASSACLKLTGSVGKIRWKKRKNCAKVIRDRFATRIVHSSRMPQRSAKRLMSTLMRQRVFAVVCCVAWWMSYEMKGDAEQFASRTSGPVTKGAALVAKLLNLIEFPLRNRCCFSPAPTYRDWPQEDWTLQCCFRPWNCVYFAADPLVTCKLWSCGVPV